MWRHEVLSSVPAKSRVQSPLHGQAFPSCRYLQQPGASKGGALGRPAVCAVFAPITRQHGSGVC